MKKYGELGRIKHNGYQYIIESVKERSNELKDEMYIPYINIYITLKSAKKNRSKSLDKLNLHYELLDETFNLGVIRKLLVVFGEWLEVVHPKYIAFSVFRDSKWIQEKRYKFYDRRLKEFGYELYKKGMIDGEEIYCYKALDS